MKIVLCCTNGLSTSMLMKKMREYIESQGIDATVQATAVENVVSKSVKGDVILLGPQVRFEIDNVKKSVDGIPVDVVSMSDYGMMNGAKVVRQAMKMYES